MKKFIITFILAILCGISAFAYDFYATCESGQRLYYDIIPSTSLYAVQVTPQRTTTPPAYNSGYYPTGDLTIPESVTYNGITYSVTRIGYRAFMGCSGLTSVTIPNSVTSIFEEAFSGCSGLVEMTIPFVGGSASATTVSASTLFGYIFGSSRYTGGTYVTQYYGSGTNDKVSYYIPSSLRSVTVTGGKLQYGAFYGCSMLTSVTIGDGVTSIGNYAFRNCNGLTTVNFNATNCRTMGSLSNPVFSGCTSLATLNIGENVTKIPEYAFYGCSGLTGTLTIPNSVTSISQYTFSGCSGLTSISIPNSVTSIGNSAFAGCYGLSGTLTIPNSVTSIGERAFYYCSGLASVTIPNSVTSIGEWAFYNCSGLTSVSIPNSVTSISQYTFSGCSGLTSISIPNSVTSIGSSAFYNCSGLTEVTIGNGVTSIGRGAFQNCSGLVDMTIPFVGGRADATAPSDTTLFGYIFNYSTSSGTGTIGQQNTGGHIYAYIPSSLRSVTVTGGNLLQGAFMNCSMLTSATIGNSVTSIGKQAFSRCSGLTEVTISSTVTSIGESAFTNCSGLTSFTIPNSVTSIDDWAFSGCSGLTSVTIGNSVTDIGVRAFSNCSGLTDIYANPTIPPSITSGAFINVSLSATLWVPCGSLVAYQQASGWSIFTDIRERLPYTLNVASADLTMGTASIAQQDCIEGTAIIEATPNRGYAFSLWNDGNTDNPRTVTVTADVEYTASFVALPAYTITAESADENRGTVTGSGIFYEGETATLTATANDGYVFGSWTDGNNDNPRTVTVTENATYTATFKAWRTITVISANETQGTVSGSGTYLEDAEIEISAIPAEHHHFTQWNDGNTDNPRTITVSVNATYTASFAIDQHTVTVVSADTEMGTVSEGGTYDYGTEIQISATPAEGYGFATWNDGNTDNPRTITVTEDITYTATFGAWRTITVLSADETMGTTSGSGTYLEGAQVEISADAVEHYHFAQWNDGNTDNPRTITVTGDSTFTASFAIDRFTITVESADEAMGTVSESNTYDYGAEIQISATASNGYHFAQWSDGNTDNPRTITVTGDATYIATFAPNNYTIVVRSLNEDWGTVSEGGTFPYGTEIQISATPRENYAFVAWTDGNTDNPRTITVVADAEYTAAFTWSVGIDETAVSEIALFPNPATDILNITSSETISEIEIVNVMGQVVKRMGINADNAVCDVEELKAGVYVVRIHAAKSDTSTTLSVRRFVKE